MKQEANNYNLMLPSSLIYFNCINCINISNKSEKDKTLILDTDEKAATESQYLFSVNYCKKKLDEH